MEHLISKHYFKDFEAFTETLDGYDLEVKQLGLGSFTADIQQIYCPTVFISQISTSLRIEAVGSPPPDLRTFGIPTDNCQPFVWRDQKTEADTIQIYSPTTELSVITDLQFEAIDISMSEKDLNALNHLWGFPELADIVNGGDMVVCDPLKMRTLRNTLNFICESVRTRIDCLKQDVELQNIVNYQLPFLLVEALMTSATRDIKANAKNRNRALKNAIDYIEASHDKTITVEEVCLQTGVNSRTLQRAFMDKYGVTAKYYLQMLRLNSVHKVLLHSEPGSIRISDVALEEGYWHMSQFATDYRRLFGELPSTTLHRSN